MGTTPLPHTQSLPALSRRLHPHHVWLFRYALRLTFMLFHRMPADGRICACARRRSRHAAQVAWRSAVARTELAAHGAHRAAALVAPFRAAVASQSTRSMRHIYLNIYVWRYPPRTHTRDFYRAPHLLPRYTRGLIPIPFFDPTPHTPTFTPATAQTCMRHTTSGTGITLPPPHPTTGILPTTTLHTCP